MTSINKHDYSLAFFSFFILGKITLIICPWSETIPVGRGKTKRRKLKIIVLFQVYEQVNNTFIYDTCEQLEIGFTH